MENVLRGEKYWIYSQASSLAWNFINASQCFGNFLLTSSPVLFGSAWGIGISAFIIILYPFTGVVLCVWCVYLVFQVSWFFSSPAWCPDVHYIQHPRDDTNPFGRGGLIAQILLQHKFILCCVLVDLFSNFIALWSLVELFAWIYIQIWNGLRIKQLLIMSEVSEDLIY